MTPEDHTRLMNRVSLAGAYLHAALRDHGPGALARAAETLVAEDDALHPAAVALIRDGARAMAERERLDREGDT